MQKKLLKLINQKAPKNKARQKKHISNPNTNSTNRIKIKTKQIERKNIITRNKDKKIGIHK